MNYKCEYCGSLYSADLSKPERCINCGAPFSEKKEKSKLTGQDRYKRLAMYALAAAVAVVPVMYLMGSVKTKYYK